MALTLSGSLGDQGGRVKSSAAARVLQALNLELSYG